MGKSLREMWSHVADALAEQSAPRQVVIACDVSAGYVDVEVVCQDGVSVTASGTTETSDEEEDDDLFAEEGDGALEEMRLMVLASARDPRLRPALKCPIQWEKTFDGHR